MDQATPPPAYTGVSTDLQLGGATPDEPLPRRLERLEDYRRRIKLALTAFMEKVPAAVRVGLDEFMPCIDWSNGHALAAPPRRAARHVHDPARCSVPIKLALAEFHVADAVQVYHAAINHMNHPILWPMAITGLGKRVRTLEGLARAGLDGSRVSGSESAGYHLIDARNPVVEKDRPPIFGNHGITREPEDKGETGDQT